MRVGILALQGAFIEHEHVFRRLGVQTEQVRTPDDLWDLDGLVLPGGESTSMRLLAGLSGLSGALREYAGHKAVWGVCAGMILLARGVEGEAPFLGVMDIATQRNAYGRQQESFVAQIRVDGLRVSERPFQGVFIRAPRITRMGPGVEVLARQGGDCVVVRQGRLLASSFHPELTPDTRMHELFLEMCVGNCDAAISTSRT